MTETRAKIEGIISYMEKRFNQDSDEYSFFIGSRPMIIRYDEDTAISTWACGAIICIGSSLYFIQEDDGSWFTHDMVDTDRINAKGKYSDWAIRYGEQCGFSIGWAESFANALQELLKYVNENGYPVYYSGTNRICHYTLNKKESIQYEQN